MTGASFRDDIIEVAIMNTPEGLDFSYNIQISEDDTATLNAIEG